MNYISYFFSTFLMITCFQVQAMLPEGWVIPSEGVVIDLFQENHKGYILGDYGSYFFEPKNPEPVVETSTDIQLVSCNLESFCHYNGIYMKDLYPSYRVSDQQRLDSFKKFFLEIKADIYCFQEFDIGTENITGWARYLEKDVILKNYCMVHSPKSNLVILFDPHKVTFVRAQVHDGARIQAVEFVCNVTGQHFFVCNNHARFNMLEQLTSIYKSILDQISILPAIVVGDWNTDLGAPREDIGRGNTNLSIRNELFPSPDWAQLMIGIVTSRSSIDLFEEVDAIFTRGVKVFNTKIFPEDHSNLLVLSNENVTSSTFLRYKTMKHYCCCSVSVYKRHAKIHPDNRHFSDHRAMMFCFKF